MGVFVSDTFSGETSNVVLTDHTGEVGATWTASYSYSAPSVSSTYDNVYNTGGSGGTRAAYASGSPATAEYDVEAVISFLSSVSGRPGITGRESASADTKYHARYSDTGEWQLYKIVGGAWSLLGTYTQTLSAGTDYVVNLEIRDASKKVYIDGAERISSSNNDITDSGHAGLRLYGGDVAPRIDNFFVTDASSISPINDTGSITQVDAISLPGAEISEGYDSGAPTIVEALPLPGVEAGTTSESGSLASAVLSTISGGDLAFASDAAALITAKIVPLPGDEFSTVNEIGGLVLVDVIPLAEPQTGIVFDAGSLLQISAVPVTGSDIAQTDASGGVTPCQVSILAASEIATAIDNAMLVNIYGHPIAAIETMEITELAELTIVSATTLIAVSSTGKEIRAIFGMPVVVPAFRGAPNIVHTIHGTPKIRRES